MTDLELLELAAKAACIELVWNDRSEPGYFSDWKGYSNWNPWNPLTDDGDALRLANRLSMSVEISEHEESTYAYAGKAVRVYAMEMWRQDKDSATRLAIVRAAAQIQINKETK